MQRTDIISILKSLPIDFMANTAAELHTDYKAKKLGSLRLFCLLLIGFLRNSAMSQRFVCEQSSCEILNQILDMSIPVTPVSHSSLSERLSNIDSKFFARVYEKIFESAEKELGADKLLDLNIIRIDTTLVSETSSKLKEGINTGVNHRFGGTKRHIKYGMGYDGFGAVLEKVFKRQKESGEEIALAQTIKETIVNTDSKGKTIVFDRGVSSFDNLCEIRKLCKENDCHFVSRLKSKRIYNVKESLIKENNPTCDGEFEIMEDCIATLNKPAKSEYENEPFRIIRVRFVKPRPRTRPSDKSRRYEPEMLLITDQTDKSALEIVNQYKRRWDIEVFYKFLKQNLKFSHLLSLSENGIQIMLYMTLITAILVKLFAERNGIGNTLAQTRMIVQIENWIFKHPVRTKNIKYTDKHKMQKKPKDS